MSVYAIAVINISDRNEYAKYEKGFMEIFSGYGGEFLSLDESPRVVEGQWPHKRTVLMKFPNEGAFQRWYSSKEYQALAKHRFIASATNMVIISGLEDEKQKSG